MKEIAGAYLSTEVNDVVETAHARFVVAVPACFSGSQRQATKDAEPISSVEHESVNKEAGESSTGEGMPNEEAAGGDTGEGGAGEQHECENDNDNDTLEKGSPATVRYLSLRT